MGIRQRIAWVASLIPTLAVRDLRARYRHSILDLTWALLTPMLTLAVYGTILTKSFSVEAACSPYLSSAWLGLVIWTFFATGVGNAVTSLIASGDLITKVYFPREAIPLASVASALLDLGIGLISLIAVLLFQRVHIGTSSLWALLALSVVIVWSAFLSVITSVLAVFSRDVVHAVHLMLRLAFFATPVVYESSFLPPAFAWVTTWSPIAVALDGLRTSVLCGTRPDVKLLVIQLAVGAGLLLLSIPYVGSVESSLADVS